MARGASRQQGVLFLSPGVPVGQSGGVNLRPSPGGALVCSAWLLVQSAAADYRFDVWTADSGLPQNFIGRIVQSRDGYLWMSTLDGLVRFDGVRFTVFNRGNSPGLLSNRLLALYQDRDEALWIGLEAGSGLVRYHRGRFEALGAPHGLPDFSVLSLSGDVEGNAWAMADQAPLQWTGRAFARRSPGIVNLIECSPRNSYPRAESLPEWRRLPSRALQQSCGAGTSRRGPRGRQDGTGAPGKPGDLQWRVSDTTRGPRRRPRRGRTGR